jgi:hypothetical protein
MFNWLRTMARNAVLAGVNDAMDDLKKQAEGLPSDPALMLSETVALLPAPDESVSETPTRRKRAV